MEVVPVVNRLNLVNSDCVLSSASKNFNELMKIRKNLNLGSWKLTFIVCAFKAKHQLNRKLSDILGCPKKRDINRR